MAILEGSIPNSLKNQSGTRLGGAVFLIVMNVKRHTGDYILGVNSDGDLIAYSYHQDSKIKKAMMSAYTRIASILSNKKVLIAVFALVLVLLQTSKKNETNN